MENSKNDWDMISHWLRSMGIWNEKSGWVAGELILQVSLIFVARFLRTPGASGMLENPQLYDPVTDSWRNYHLSSGQYLPIMLQAWGRCWKIPFLLKDSFLQECHSFLTQHLNSKILGQWQRSWLMDGVCASVQKSLTGGGACLLFLSPSVLTVQKGLVSAAASAGGWARAAAKPAWSSWWLASQLHWFKAKPEPALEAETKERLEAAFLYKSPY